MKRWMFTISLVIIVAVMLYLCSQTTTTYPFMQEESAITEIEIVDICSYNIVNTGNFDSIRVLKKIDSPEHLAFLSSFRDIPCKKSLGPSSGILEGLAIRIFFQDGSFQLIGAETSFYCSASNGWSYIAYYFDYDAFNQCIMTARQ